MMFAFQTFSLNGLKLQVLELILIGDNTYPINAIHSDV